MRTTFPCYSCFSRKMNKIRKPAVHRRWRSRNAYKTQSLKEFGALPAAARREPAKSCRARDSRPAPLVGGDRRFSVPSYPKDQERTMDAISPEPLRDDLPFG